MATLRWMFQTPRSCSASAVSSTSSHTHLLLFVFFIQNFFSIFSFFHLGAWSWNFLRFCLPENVFILPSSLVDSLARYRILCSKSGVGKLWPTGQTHPLLVLVNEGLQKHSHAHFFIDIMAAFVLHWQSWIVAKKTTQPTKCEILTIFPLKRKACLPLFKIIITQDVEILLHCFLLMRMLRALSYYPMLMMSVWLLGSLLFSLWRLFRLSLYLCIYLKYHQVLFLIYPF